MTPTSVSPDMAKALRVASIVAAAHLLPSETVLFRTTRGGAGESWSRLELYWLLHTACGMSLTGVGRVLGGRDKSTVKNGVERVENALCDPGYAHRMERLAALCKELVGIGACQDEATDRVLRTASGARL